MRDIMPFGLLGVSLGLLCSVMLTPIQALVFSAILVVCVLAWATIYSREDL